MLKQQELNALECVLQYNQITREKVELKNKETKKLDASSWDHVATPFIDPPLETFETNRYEVSNNIVGSWD